MLVPNPSSRISIAKIMDSSWFRQSLSKSLRTKEEQELAVEDETMLERGRKETLNAFHVIFLSEIFDLSPLFEEKKRVEKEELRLTSTRPASKQCDFEARGGGRDENFQRKEKRFLRQAARARDWKERKLGIAADVFSVAASFPVVEVKKFSGDTLDYNWCYPGVQSVLQQRAYASA